LDTGVVDSLDWERIVNFLVPSFSEDDIGIAFCKPPEWDVDAGTASGIACNKSNKLTQDEDISSYQTFEISNWLNPTTEVLKSGESPKSGIPVFLRKGIFHSGQEVLKSHDSLQGRPPPKRKVL
jgi:hypothetical protein